MNVQEKNGKILMCHRLCEPRYQAYAQLKRYLTDNNFEVEEGSPRRSGYDVAILVMCAFSNSFENFAFDWLDIMDSNKLILTGCFPKIAKQRLNHNYDTFDMMRDIGGVGEILRKRGFNILPFSQKNYVEDIICVAQGCNHRCTYCVSRQAIGRLKSKSIVEIQHLIQASSDPIGIAGDDMGSWGMDLGLGLPDLFGILDISRLSWISDINPWKFVEFASEIHNFLSCTIAPLEIGVPIHSGSPRILDLMGRGKTDLERVATAVHALKKLEHITTRTSVILGFPGETEEEFIRSIEFSTDVFDRPCFIEFSPRPRTPAWQMPGRIDPKTIHTWIERHLRAYLESNPSSYLYVDEPLLPERWPRSEWNRSNPQLMNL